MTTLSDVEFLLSERGRELAQQFLPLMKEEHNQLSLLEQLRREILPSHASALFSLVKARHRAEKRFPQSDRLFFTGEALEQSTAWPIAQYRAQWMHDHAPPGPILDLGCGIGGDLLALAQLREVIGYESDPIRARFAQANAEEYQVNHRVQIRGEDWVYAFRQGTLPKAGAAFVDPVRRRHGKRVFNVEEIQPPLSMILELQKQVPSLCIKLMPGIQDRDLPADGNVTFVSHDGICKEAMLWLQKGAAMYTKSPSASGRRAAIYRQGVWIERESSLAQPPVAEIHVGQILHEPDPALIRAGAFAELCQELNGWLFDPQIAYLVTSQREQHPLTQSFHIWEVHPFNLKKLNQRLHVLNVGQVELKKRGAPFEPEQLRKRLTLVPGGRPAVILFTRRGEERLMIIGERVGRRENEWDEGI